MAESDSPELAELAVLIRVRNDIETRISRLVNRPTSTGGMGEWIAARIFDIELESRANNPGYDGRFTTGPLRGKTVNVKTYTRHENTLDTHPHAQFDYYLVFTGPVGAPISSQGTTRPTCIERVFLFDRCALHQELERRVKMGVGASVRKALWDNAEIYPQATNPLLIVSDLQRGQLELFTPE